MDDFCYRDLIQQWHNGVVIGGLNVDKIIKKFATPTFVYDLEIVEKKYQMLRTKLAKNVKMFYALKANGNLAVAEKLANLGCGADIASFGEFLIARKARFREIIFSGPGKQELEIKNVGTIGSYHVESMEEARIIAKLFPNQQVGIRINASFEVKNGIFSATGGPQKFGIDEEKAVESIKEMKKLGLTIVGLHCYAASGVLDVGLIIKNVERIMGLADRLEKELEIVFKYVDIGGGLGVPYKDEEKPVDIEKFCNYVNKIAERREIWIELGRFLVAESGIFIMKIVDIKESRGQKITITDGGVHNLLRPAIYGQHPIIAIKAPAIGEERYEIGGPLCTPMDFLAKDAKLPELHIGDNLAVLNAGAYGFSEGMTFFLMHPIAAEVSVERGTIVKARAKIPAEKYMKWLEGEDGTKNK